MSERDKKCEDRIDDELKSTVDYMRKIWAVYTGQDPETDEITEESFSEYGLSFDYVEAGTFEDQDEGYFRYQLSWGGPSDEFRFFCDPGYNCHRIEYRFMDWYDGACRLPIGSDKEFILEIWESYFRDVAESVYAEAVA